MGYLDNIIDSLHQVVCRRQDCVDQILLLFGQFRFTDQVTDQGYIIQGGSQLVRQFGNEFIPGTGFKIRLFKLFVKLFGIFDPQVFKSIDQSIDAQVGKDITNTECSAVLYTHEFEFAKEKN